MRCIRDEEAATYRSCAFVGNFAALALGTHSGEVRLHDTLSGDLIDTLDAHESPVYQLRVSMALLTCGHRTPSFRIRPVPILLRSSSRKPTACVLLQRSAENFSNTGSFILYQVP